LRSERKIRVEDGSPDMIYKSEQLLLLVLVLLLRLLDERHEYQHDPLDPDLVDPTYDEDTIR
jgi:hypothetical protein